MSSRSVLAVLVCASFAACGGPETFHGLQSGLGGQNAGTPGTAGTNVSPAGAAGDSGQGTAGTSIPSGAAGDSSAGTNGAAGSAPAGTNGTAGTTAAAGTNGTAGTTAAAGTNGTAGTTAAAGTNGAAGTKGAAGTTAAAGTNGAAGTAAAGTNGGAGTAAAGTNGGAGTAAAGNSGGAGTAPTGPVIKIDSGNLTTGAAPFVADIDFTGGNLNAVTNNAIDVSGVANPAPQAVYQTGRVAVAPFSYTIPGYTANSMHTVRLHFCETYWPPAGMTTATGKRTCNVTLQGAQVLTAYDIWTKAGNAKFKAVVEQFTVAANGSGAYVIQFTAVSDQCLVNGIEVQ
jgi:Malectin domain